MHRARAYVWLKGGVEQYRKFLLLRLLNRMYEGSAYITTQPPLFSI